MQETFRACADVSIANDDSSASSGEESVDKARDSEIFSPNSVEQSYEKGERFRRGPGYWHHRIPDVQPRHWEQGYASFRPVLVGRGFRPRRRPNNFIEYNDADEGSPYDEEGPRRKRKEPRLGSTLGSGTTKSVVTSHHDAGGFKGCKFG